MDNIIKKGREEIKNRRKKEGEGEEQSPITDQHKPRLPMKQAFDFTFFLFKNKKKESQL